MANSGGITTDEKGRRYLNGAPLCTHVFRKGRRKGEPCRRIAVKNRPYCKDHGGRNPVGIDTPMYIHGRRSKYSPATIAATIDEIMADPPQRILDIREDIATTEGLLRDALEKLETGEGPNAWKQVQTHYRAMQTALRTGDIEGAQRHLNEMGPPLAEGASDSEARQQVAALTRQSADLRGRLFNMMKEHDEIITTKQLLAFLSTQMVRLGERVAAFDFGDEFIDTVGRDIEELLSTTFKDPVPRPSQNGPGEIPAANSGA